MRIELYSDELFVDGEPFDGSTPGALIENPARAMVADLFEVAAVSMKAAADRGAPRS